MRFDQVIPSIVERDAVSHHTLEAQAVLRSMGFVSEIFARNHGPGLAGRVRLLDALPRDEGGRQWLCYQLSIGSPAAEPVIAHPGPKIVNYHNITPPELVESFMPFLGGEVRLGRRQLLELAPLCELGIGDSAYNAAELDSAGYRRSAVAPLMIDRSNSTHGADPKKAAELRVPKGNGGADWLFVGQMLPHKAHHDVIRAFACYRRAYDPAARLHLVGRESCQPYGAAVRALAGVLGLGSSIEVVGSVSAADLAAYYEAADVFVCCSDHEGFCVPLLEAMYHRLPIVAYGTAAVPETVLDAGVVLASKEPALVAAAVRRVLTDTGLREAIVKSGLERAAGFTAEGARQAFREAVEAVVGQVARSVQGRA
ncbi:MAG: glycosyltransferase [Acidimicrobiales bacterium]